MIKERLLNKIASMSSLSPDSVNLLLSSAQQNEFSRGEIILDEGMVCNYLYFVEKGWLRTYNNQDGKDININFTFEGDFTSNIKSLKKEQPSKHVIVAGEKSIITSFYKKDLLRLYSNSLEIELLCRKILGSFLIESNEQIDFQKLQSPIERYEFLIKNKPEMIQKISISQLASYIGVARETLSRIRKINFRNFVIIVTGLIYNEFIVLFS